MTITTCLRTYTTKIGRHYRQIWFDVWAKFGVNTCCNLLKNQPNEVGVPITSNRRTLSNVYISKQNHVYTCLYIQGAQAFEHYLNTL